MAAQRFFERFRLVREASDRLSAVDDLGELLAVLQHQARAIADADGVAVVRREGDTVVYVGEDSMAPLWAGQRFAIGRCVTGLAILAGAPVVIPDIIEDERVPLELYLTTFVRSVAVFPVGTPAVAALALYWRSPQPLGRDVDFLVTMLTRQVDAILRSAPSCHERSHIMALA